LQNLCNGKTFPHTDFSFNFFTQIHHIDQQNAAWFESDFSVNGASCIVGYKAPETLFIG